MDSVPISDTCKQVSPAALDAYRDVTALLGYTLIGCDEICAPLNSPNRRANCTVTRHGKPQTLICNGRHENPITPEMTHNELVARAKRVCHGL